MDLSRATPSPDATGEEEDAGGEEDGDASEEEDASGEEDDDASEKDEDVLMEENDAIEENEEWLEWINQLGGECRIENLIKCFQSLIDIQKKCRKSNAKSVMRRRSVNSQVLQGRHPSKSGN